MEYLNTGVSYEKLALTVNALYKIPLAFGRLTLGISGAHEPPPATSLA
jgi:hypothetical protein